MRSRRRETLEHLAIALALSGTAASREGDWVGKKGARRHAKVRWSMMWFVAVAGRVGRTWSRHGLQWGHNAPIQGPVQTI
jgi:hypothetical protein